MKKLELAYVTYIRTTPKKLWDAITKPEFASQYWGGQGNISNWKKGSSWHHGAEGKPEDACVVGEVLESQPPKRLVLSWADPDKPTIKSRVTFEIERIKDMVSLRVIHGEVPAGSAMAKNVASGWPRVLASMKSYLETGKGLDVYGGH
jgi:uncharacterized protein YndB with AHSA1/START domain